VDRSLITWHLELSTLAPDIVTALLGGVELNGLSLAKLMSPFPEG
jgi:hypothetical protein